MSGSLQLVIEFLRSAFGAGNIGSSRGYTDVFADRLTRALTEPTLLRAFEHLLRSLNCDTEAIHPPLAARVMSIPAEDARAIAAWIRDHAKLVALLAATKDETLLEETLATIEIPALSAASGAAAPRGDFEIGITATCLAPLAHGAEGKAGNATLFRRQAIITDSGAVVTLPFYGGNAVRGQIRDLLADHFLSTVGIKPELWFFYALYSGGALEEGSAALKAMTKRLGDHGAIRTEGLREFRQHIVMLSTLGCAMGNRILGGRVQVSDLRPRCAEWGTGEMPAASLVSWEYLTRREDDENHIENHSMIANTECIKVGTVLDGGIDIERGATPLERSCMARGILLLQERGKIGAENRRGFGRVSIELSGDLDPSLYDAHLVENRDAIRAYLLSVAAVTPEAA